MRKHWRALMCHIGRHHWMRERHVGPIRVKPGTWAEYMTRQCWDCPRMETHPSRVIYASTASSTGPRDGA